CSATASAARRTASCSSSASRNDRPPRTPPAGRRAGVVSAPAEQPAVVVPAGARAVALTALTMLAFAGNSILCRLALKETAIDPASFAALRLASGVAALAIIVSIAERGERMRANGGWGSALALFLYAAFFAFAYVDLDAASGA